MTAENHPAARFARARHHIVTTAALVIVFWMAAAGAVIAAQKMLERRHPATATVVTIAAIVATAYVYTRFCAREAGVSHALGVGAAWLLLGVATEVMMAAHTGPGSYAMLGSPDRPLLRNVFFFVWIFGPVLFARRESEQ